jgi:hypothetical protein
MAKEVLSCAAAPCKSCPYRQDAPSGLWAAHEYDKLPAYDGAIVEQAFSGATGVFLCHQRDGHLCAGWIATHGADNLLAIRMLPITGGSLDPSVWDYESPVPVFASGQEACEHGKRDIEEPGNAAQRMMTRLMRKIGE